VASASGTMTLVKRMRDLRWNWTTRTLAPGGERYGEP
jgi:hypothetical protein